MGFKEYDVVRIAKLVQPDRRVDGTAGVMRRPRVGDVGTIVSVLSDAEVYTVECVDPDGRTVCLADFLQEELELS